MSSFGRTVLGNTGYPVQVAADGRAEFKNGGVTLDWSTVTACTATTVLTDQNTVQVGQKALPFGTILFKNTGTGKYQPALSTSTLVEGETFILNETVFQNPPLGLGSIASDHPAVIQGGNVRAASLQVGGTTPAGLGAATQPTLAAVLAVLPRVFPVEF